MKGSWLLAPVLVGVLAAGGVPARRTPGEVTPPLALAIQRVHGALAQKDLRTASSAAHDAHRVAASGGQWEALVEVGDTYRRVGEVAGAPEPYDAKAREVYLAALSRARLQESLDGVLRVADALAAVGDRKGFEESVRIAEALAAWDPDARADVRALAARFADLGPSRGD